MPSAHQSSKPAGPFTRVLGGEHVPGAAWVRYCFAAGLVGTALAARFAMLPLNGGLAFNTFYPAVITAVLLFGVGPGVVATVLSAMCAVYFFLPPYLSFLVEGGYLISLGFFLSTCALTCALGHRLNSLLTQLRASEHKLRALFETSNVGIVLMDMNRRYVDFNETFRRFTGYEGSELRTLEYRALIAETDWAASDEQLALAKNEGQLGPYEKVYIRKDGSRVPLRFNGALFAGEDGQDYLWSIVEDITDRRQLEIALLTSTSAEQHKLGRDLHDGLGQELAGISLLAAAIASSIHKTGRTEAGELDNLANLAARAVANCRAMAHGLLPVTFTEGGLIDALNEMVALLRDSFGIEARCEVIESASIRLGAEALDNLYRISREAISNARRHGGAKSIMVTLDVQPSIVRLEIQDDGIGLPQPPPSTGMGLKIMQFRAAAIGAHLSIEPWNAGGTLVHVECPQPPEIPQQPP